ncbi:MAG: phage holin family protein [Roseiarcus sp.]|uniref:phage holin family protein n=1 Tax=Roseiarcus sp. TaxID=1969460 RepID=UPI003C6252DC
MPGERSISQLVGDSLAELSKLVQNEIDLARAELSDKVALTGGAVKLIAAGAILLIPGIVLILFSIASELIQLGWSAPLAYLCSGGGAVVIAGALAWAGMSRLSASTLKPTLTLNEIRRDTVMATELMR